MTAVLVVLTPSLLQEEPHDAVRYVSEAPQGHGHAYHGWDGQSGKSAALGNLLTVRGPGLDRLEPATRCVEVEGALGRRFKQFRSSVYCRLE